MLYSLRDKYKRLRFARACAGVRATPPVRLDPRSNVTLFTQLQHKDVLLALIAFKSFAQRVRAGSLCVLDDGSLTEEDRALLTAHLPDVEFVATADVRTSACPAGGCWERLLWIAKLTRDQYVVQLDSDTLTAGEVPEVQACIDEGRSFAIGTWDNQDFETMAFRSRAATEYLVAHPENQHVQVLAEAAFTKLANHHTLRYVRGCAGFSGFARGSVDAAFIETISTQMRLAIGNVWDRWGSEQVMSNIVVANDPRAKVLPHPKYCDCTKLKQGQAAFVHFIGSCRFVGNVYQDMARDVIDRL